MSSVKESKIILTGRLNGYEFCGEAGDGELAYPMIQKLRPDIVITDIRMRLWTAWN